MVGVGQTKHAALARCSIVDYHGYVVYDQYIKPKKEITDYRTKWSGILPIHMKHAVPFKLARKEILKLIKTKIVVGHSLHYDFQILKINMHERDIRDIAKNISLRKMGDFPLNKVSSLKKLSFSVLGRNIQCGTHCSIEDSVSAMDLYKLVEHEWEIENGLHHKYLEDIFWPT